MPLVQPKNNALVGGYTYLIFDEVMPDFDLTINGENFHYIKDDIGYIVDLNYIIPGQPIDIVVSVPKEDDPRIQITLAEVTVYKPPHDTGGMGATVIRDDTGEIIGTFFKFWLPNVNSVYVRGSFNEWLDKNRLNQLEDSGYWYGFSEQAKPDNDYIFFAYVEDGDFSEISDPAARATLKTRHNSEDENDANGVIVDPFSFKWQNDNSFAEKRRNFSTYIIYQVHWGTFLRDDTNQSNYEHFLQGDTEDEKLDILRKKLSYISSLGFTAIQLLPVHQANGSTNAGYDPSFFFAIETAYGSPEDLRVLVDEAHGMGLAVLFDTVINHLTAEKSYSSFSQEFIRGWYTRENAPWSGGWGPTPDFDRVQIQNLLRDSVAMYFDEYHVDGVRFDSTPSFPQDGLTAIISGLLEKYSDKPKYLIAEQIVDDPFPYIVGLVGFNASWYKPAWEACTFQAVGQMGQGSLQALEKLFETDYQGNTNTAIKYCLGSHDELWSSHGGASAISHFEGGDEFFAYSKMRLAYALNICCLGTPMLFMGTENLTPISWHEYFGYNGNNVHTPGQGMNWMPVEDSVEYLFRKLITDINKYHSQLGALRMGNAQCLSVHHDESNSVKVYKRWDFFGCVLLIVINISDNQWEHKEYEINTGTPNSKWNEIFNSQSELYGGWQNSGNADVDFYPTADETGKLQGINLPKWSLLIFKQNL